jgi:3-deoxy-D-arabino-heptulosonate 7-phosphate (DAHP) synthase class II
MAEMIDRVIERVARETALAFNGGDWAESYTEEQRKFHRDRVRFTIKAFIIAARDDELLKEKETTP